MMNRWKEMQLEQILSTTQLENAYQTSLNFVKNIGFNFFAFSTSYRTDPKLSSTTRLNNYPRTYNIEYEQNNLGAIDPVVAHCNQSMLPILWSEELFGDVPSLWQTLEQQGIQHGWSQAVHDENGLCSVLSLARTHRRISQWEMYENFGFSAFIGQHLHNLAAQTFPKKQETSRGAIVSTGNRRIETGGNG